MKEALGENLPRGIQTLQKLINKASSIYIIYLSLKGFQERKEICLFVPEQLEKPTGQPVSLLMVWVSVLDHKSTLR